MKSMVRNALLRDSIYEDYKLFPYHMSHLLYYIVTEKIFKNRLIYIFRATSFELGYKTREKKNRPLLSRFVFQTFSDMIDNRCGTGSLLERNLLNDYVIRYWLLFDFLFNHGTFQMHFLNTKLMNLFGF